MLKRTLLQPKLVPAKQFSWCSGRCVGTIATLLSLLLAEVAYSTVLPRQDRQLPTGTTPFNVTSFPQRVAQRERRIALVIGNGAYGGEGNLKNPPNDAYDVEQALKGLGFEVTLLRNVTRREIDEAINRFNSQLRSGGIGLFYYAGHGMQIDGENYFVPIGAKINRESDVAYEAVPLGKVLGAMDDAGNQLNIVLIDACRINPYSRGWRSVSRGLASVQLGKGTVISFATAPGRVASDGNGRNSPYTASLLQHIQTPGLPIPLLLQQITQTVADTSKGEQIPWYSSSLTGDFVFKPNDAALSIRPPSPLPPINSPKLTAEQFYNRGLEKRRKGDNQGAIEDYTQAIKLRPNFPAAYGYRAFARSELGDKQGAVEDYTQTIKLNANDASAYYNRGFARFGLGDIQGAIEDYTQTIKLDSNAAGVHLNRGISRFQLGDIQGAIEDYTQAIKLDPNNSGIYIDRGISRSQLGDNQGAIEDYTQSIKLRSNNPNAYYNRGLAYKYQKETQRAISDFQRAADLYKQQGNSKDYQDALDRLNELNSRKNNK